MPAFVSYIYEFSQLDPTIQLEVVKTLADAANRNEKLGWQKNREMCVLPLCKYIAGLPLASEESTVLLTTQKSFDDIKTPEVLDTCLMFWQVSREDRYRNVIKSHACNPFSAVQKQAAAVCAHCM
jgi:hypothetical protein